PADTTWPCRRTPSRFPVPANLASGENDGTPRPAATCQRPAPLPAPRPARGLHLLALACDGASLARRHGPRTWSTHALLRPANASAPCPPHVARRLPPARPVL